jgi:hypothetical protein
MNSARSRAVRLAVALPIGVLFHVGWVAMFILGASLGAAGVARGALWACAPIMTATGFATGLAVPLRGAIRLEPTFWRLLTLELIGCTVGAIAGAPVGPMFAGLGGLAGGASCVLALALWSRGSRRPAGGRLP